MRAYLSEWATGSVPSPTVLDLLVALAGALGYTTLFVLGWDLRVDGWDTIGYVLLYALPSVPAPVGFVYAVLGLFVTGGTLALLFKTHRLLSPIVVVGGLVAAVWYLDQPHVYVPPPSPVEQFIVWWPLVVGLALGVGLVEAKLTDG